MLAACLMTNDGALKYTRMAKSPEMLAYMGDAMTQCVDKLLTSMLLGQVLTRLQVTQVNFRQET